MKILVVVDMQNDFLMGSLGSAEAWAVRPGVIEKIKNWNGTIIFTRDTHDENYAESQEGKYLPVRHCVKGTAGWELDPEIKELAESHGSLIIDKETFGSKDLPEAIIDLSKGENIDEIMLVGVCTDICVISNAMVLKTFFPETIISVDSSCCAGSSSESHERALESMRSCHINII